MPAGRSGGCGVSPQACPRVTNPRGYSGVPIGTLTLWSASFRGLQTLGYSCGVVSPLCLRREADACGAEWRGRGAGWPRRLVRGLKPSEYSGVPVGTLTWLRRHPGVTNPRLLLWSGFTTLACGRGTTCVEWFHHSCLRAGYNLRGVVSPLLPAGGVQLAWSGFATLACGRGATCVEWLCHSCPPARGRMPLPAGGLSSACGRGATLVERFSRSALRGACVPAAG